MYTYEAKDLKETFPGLAGLRDRTLIPLFDRVVSTVRSPNKSQQSQKNN